MLAIKAVYYKPWKGTRLVLGYHFYTPNQRWSNQLLSAELAEDTLRYSRAHAERPRADVLFNERGDVTAEPRYRGRPNKFSRRTSRHYASSSRPVKYRESAESTRNVSENKRKSIVLPFSTNICIYVFFLFFLIFRQRCGLYSAVNDEESVVVVPRRARYWAREWKGE